MQREQWGLLNTKLIQTIITVLFRIVKTAVDMQFFFPALRFVNYFCLLMLPDTELWEGISAVGIGVLQCGGDHMAVQPSVKSRVEHDFLMPPCTHGKVPLSFRYKEKGCCFCHLFSGWWSSVLSLKHLVISAILPSLVT